MPRVLTNSNPLLDFTQSLSFVHNCFRLWCAYHHEHEVTYSINKIYLLIYESIVYIKIFHFCDRCGHWTSCWYRFLISFIVEFLFVANSMNVWTDIENREYIATFIRVQAMTWISWFPFCEVSYINLYALTLKIESKCTSKFVTFVLWLLIFNVFHLFYDYQGGISLSLCFILSKNVWIIICWLLLQSIFCFFIWFMLTMNHILFYLFVKCWFSNLPSFIWILNQMRKSPLK